jgi:type I restriction enzyme M protein
MVHHLAPRGIAGLVLSNGSMSSSQSGAGDIRKGLVEADLVDCMIALPGQLFYGTAIPACLWFLARDRSGAPTKGGSRLRDRRGEVLFIDARPMGRMVSKVHRELADDEIATIAGTYHAWRGEEVAVAYQNVPGFCHGAPLEQIRGHGHILTPGRYVGAGDKGEEEEPSDVKIKRLRAVLEDQLTRSSQLTERIKKGLETLDG